jgi:glutathione S-transferase
MISLDPPFLRLLSTTSPPPLCTPPPPSGISPFQAIKDGDKDAEARYSYPKMYAEGFDEHSTAFNCVQRSHQQALETYPMFLAASLVGGMQYPLTVAAGGAWWAYARLQWAEGYALGADKRYGHWAAKGIWTGLLAPLVAAGATSLSVIVK